MFSTFKNAKLAFLAGGLFFIGLFAFSPRPIDITNNTPASTTVYDEAFLGQIVMTGNSYCPRNFMECNGQLLPINSNTALYSVMGITYGGDGRTTFAIPDLRARTAIGSGRANYSNLEVKQGDKGGLVKVTPASTGEANPVETIATLGVRYCICVQGEYPSRN
ncbi:MAG: phage tail protein [Saprospiraceae bacterium]